ncbi:hypothetical protein [Taklimakanibacter lacteus]|uniref:hypothetical protein n=1 Tax=Taklimakanibacter lacteus TaxID=2268456 RepID=UPI0013C4031D
MAYPPNYNQNRRDRERAKNQKAQEKQARREEKSRERKAGHGEDKASDQTPGTEQK